MKAKRVFLTVGLSLVMVGSVAAAGLLGISKDLKPADAATTTIYAKMEHSWWKADNAAVGIYCWGTGGTKAAWPGERMTAVTGETDMWSFDVDTAQYENVIFTRVNGSGTISDWGAKTKDQTFPTDGKNFFTITNSSATWGDPGCDGTWGIYPIPSTSYNVDVYVNNVKRGTESITEGSLPANPDTGYGKSWNGKWYFDSSLQTECTGVGSTTTALYCEVETISTITYNIDVSRATNKFADKYLYTWDDGGYKTAWPGDKLTTNSITVASDAKIIINAGEGKEQTVNITGSGIAGDTIRVLNSTDGEGHYEYIWESSIDEPAEEGYYICGNFSSNPCWTYATAEKMENTTGENVAHEMNFNLAVGDELRVRSFYNDQTPKDRWATLGDNNYADPDNGWGVKSGDNFKATKAGYYDIYAKYEGDNFMFYVAPHVDSYEISLTAKLYEGRNLVETRNLSSQLAYDGSAFNPTYDAISGYVGYGVYTDASCSTEYVPTTFSAAGQLYMKYMRTGYYVVGDADFTGSNNGAWDPNGGVRLTREVNDPQNFLEGSVTIPDVEGAVQVRPLELTAEKQINWLDFTLGATYSFASKNGNNLEFSKGGTYAVYVKLVNYQPVVYLNEGLAAFNTKFLSEVGGVCNEILAGTKTVAQLQTIWADQAAAYASLSAAEKAEVEALTIDGGKENGSDLEKVVAKYSYIVHKYGTAVCNDFIWGQTYTAQSNGMNLVMTRNNVLLITLVSVSVLAASAGLVFYFLRKKKLVK